ncbi:hypothetical protein GCM10009765_71540 [Fodinicola feengrottensis]|uniref:Antitoxin n=1 Tax=Fodinicola feengrottensis TaxID=435914 RepID=A0ABP4UVF6_9ACTN
MISQRELRNDNASIMTRVEQGESFVVTRNGVPIADLIPHQPQRKRRFVPIGEIATALADMPEWDVASWHQERAELDEVLDDAAGSASFDDDPWQHAARDTNQS